MKKIESVRQWSWTKTHPRRVQKVAEEKWIFGAGYLCVLIVSDYYYCVGRDSVFPDENSSHRSRPFYWWGLWVEGGKCHDGSADSVINRFLLATHAKNINCDWILATLSLHRHCHIHQPGSHSSVPPLCECNRSIGTGTAINSNSNLGRRRRLDSIAIPSRLLCSAVGEGGSECECPGHHYYYGKHLFR